MAALTHLDVLVVDSSLLVAETLIHHQSPHFDYTAQWPATNPSHNDVISARVHCVFDVETVEPTCRLHFVILGVLPSLLLSLSLTCHFCLSSYLFQILELVRLMPCLVVSAVTDTVP